MLDRFEAALTSGQLRANPTIAQIQDALGTGTSRAKLFRDAVVLAKADAHLLPMLVRYGRECHDRARNLGPEVEVAWTHPGHNLPPLRTSGAMARDVIDSAHKTLLVVGYSVTVDADLAGLAAQTIRAMARAAARGVVVTPILHRDPRNRSALLRGWPQGQRKPTIFTWPEQADDKMASLHAKTLVADANNALVTSANLTYHGYEANIEMGVRITGQGARQLHRAFDELIRIRDFVPWTD